MEGLYLYCIRKKSNFPLLSLKGIDQKNELFVFSHKGIEAIVSVVSSEEFDSEEIKKKVHENLGWIKEKIMIHENVIEEVMKKNGRVISVIPMKFGTIFTEEERLAETLDKCYEQFNATFNKLEDKEEWSVKIYFNNQRQLEEIISTENEKVKEIKRKIAGMPEGIAYFYESELNEAISYEVGEKIHEIKKNIFEEIKLNSEDAIECKILAKEITCRPELMILNASYLIKTEMVDEFIRSAERKNEELNAQGFSLEFSGPWPPYYFSEQNV